MSMFAQLEQCKLSILRLSQEGEDLYQDIWLKLLKFDRMRSTRGKSIDWNVDQRPLIFKVAKHTRITRLRSQIRHQSILGQFRTEPGIDLLHHIAGGEVQLAMAERFSILGVVLGRLPDQQRIAIGRRFLEAASCNSIAQELRVNPATVRQWCCRARKALLAPPEFILRNRKCSTTSVFENWKKH